MSCDDLIDSINPPSRRAGGVRISPLHIFVTALAVSKLCALGGKKRPHSQDARARLRARSHSTRLRALASGSRAMSPSDETGMASRVSGQRDWTWGAETGSATNSSFYDDEGEEEEEIYRHGVGDAGDVSEASEEEWDEEVRRRARRLRCVVAPRSRELAATGVFPPSHAAPAARVPAPGPAGGIVPTRPFSARKTRAPSPPRALQHPTDPPPPPPPLPLTPQARPPRRSRCSARAAARTRPRRAAGALRRSRSSSETSWRRGRNPPRGGGGTRRASGGSSRSGERAPRGAEFDPTLERKRQRREAARLKAERRMYHPASFWLLGKLAVMYAGLYALCHAGVFVAALGCYVWDDLSRAPSPAEEFAWTTLCCFALLGLPGLFLHLAGYAFFPIVWGERFPEREKALEELGGKLYFRFVRLKSDPPVATKRAVDVAAEVLSRTMPNKLWEIELVSEDDLFVGAANVRELAYPRDRARGGEWSSKRRGCFSSFSLARRSAEEDLDRDPGPSRCDLLEYAVEASGAGWGDWVVHMGADSVLNQRAVDAIAFHAAPSRASSLCRAPPTPAASHRARLDVPGPDPNRERARGRRPGRSRWVPAAAEVLRAGRRTGADAADASAAERGGDFWRRVFSRRPQRVSSAPSGSGPTRARRGWSSRRSPFGAASAARCSRGWTRASTRR